MNKDERTRPVRGRREPALPGFHIIDDGKITASILIEADTHLGPRDVIVETPTGYEVMPGGFTVN